MSLARSVKRKKFQQDLKLNGIRSTCRKCKARMTFKPGYGCVCEECGWWPSKQIRAKGELDNYGRRKEVET